MYRLALTDAHGRVLAQRQGEPWELRGRWLEGVLRDVEHRGETGRCPECGAYTIERGGKSWCARCGYREGEG